MPREAPKFCADGCGTKIDRRKKVCAACSDIRMTKARAEDNKKRRKANARATA